MRPPPPSTQPLRGAIAAAARSRLAAVAALGAVAAALAAGASPLMAIPGLELGLAASIASACLLGPALGIAAARRELAAAPSSPSPLRAFLAAATTACGLVLVLLVASALRARLTSPCRPLAGAGLFAVVAFPSAALAAAVGVAAGTAARGRRRAAWALHALTVAASLASTVLAVYLGPAAAAYDHLLGVWPGPVYDEALAVDARLVAFRAGTLAWTGAAVCAAALVLRRRARAPWRGPAGVLAGLVALAFVARAAGGRPPSRAELARALGAVREGPRCVVHLPAEKGPAEADRALRDCEYDADAVARVLALPRPPRATVWIYRSAEEKRRLVGAGQTSFTKPWLAEVHVQDEGWPHPVLRHELVHALASAGVRGVLGVPARGLVLVNPGLIEGLAVAVEVPAGEHGVHAWARALRDQGRLPSARALMAAGFFGASPARAYTAAGSFVRFLLQRYGPGAVMAAYRQDDVARGIGRPLAELDAEWRRLLDGVAVPPALAAAAEARFERGSVFERACAREVAALERDAADEARRGRAADAEVALRRASALSGGDPAPLRGAAEAWRTAGDLDRAAALLEEALRAAAAAGGRTALRRALLAARGDVQLARGELAAASASYTAALDLGPDGAEARGLRARLEASRRPGLRAHAAPWLIGGGDPAVALSRLPEDDGALARYLLARARLGRRAPTLALSDLLALDPAALPDAAFALEARRMTADALCRVGRWSEGIAAWTALAAGAAGDAAREQAEDGARRCAFERDAYGVATTWDGDLPRGR